MCYNGETIAVQLHALASSAEGNFVKDGLWKCFGQNELNVWENIIAVLMNCAW